jgi:3',5'-cyclic AMP phosphodiesterase CpdA
MMERREFIRRLGLGLVAGWAGGRLAWPLPAWAAGPEMRLALMADAHLKDGDDRRPEALALARAVAEIRSLSPPPDLVLFAGDLAHRGRPDALDLGREILSDLPATMWAVPGEGDHGPSGSAWTRRFGESRFCRAWRGFQILGLHTSLKVRPGGPVFEIGAAPRQWLAAELARLDPATPLIVLSHAPLTRIFHPWQQWTEDAPEVASLLARFAAVLCLHGHVHGAGVKGQGSGIIGKIPPIPPVKKGDLGGFSEAGIDLNTFGPRQGVTENRKPKTKIHLSLPATAWPHPQAVQGTPRVIRPGVGPRGCGWALATLGPSTGNFQPYLWQV